MNAPGTATISYDPQLVGRKERTVVKLSPAKMIAMVAVVLVGLALPRPATAYCDTLDGPVVTDARAALAAGDVTPVLKWVRPADEAEIRAAFAKALAARSQGEAAREVADRWFFEALVRIHRAGEGAPFTGLKSGGEVDPGIAAADRALQEGDVQHLAERLASRVVDGVRERFVRAREARRHAGESVAAGREYVAAYVSYIHYVEGIHTVVGATASAVHGH